MSFNDLAGIVPKIVNIFVRKNLRGAQQFRVQKKVLTYDRRHDNKRGWYWWVKKTGFRLKEWWEYIN
jgi:hypothetical protein